MPKIRNIFTEGRMDSDKHNSFQSDKGYKRAENLRPSGKGDDGVMKKLKGSKQVSTLGNEVGMIVLGAYEGADNKNYFLRAMPNGKSQVIEYDVITEQSRIVIQDTQILRFDLVRWNAGVVIKPYKFILSINQISDLLFISNEAWMYPRVIDLKRDYSLGFTADDIILAKKPPKEAPLIIESTTQNYDNDNNDTFVSFSYRYKYADGDFSALSFYSDTAFWTSGEYKVDAKKANLGMVNLFDNIKLQVNSGGENVTDVEVFAREHGSNTAYKIYTINKDKNGIADNVPISNIEYKFSTNYEVLDEETTNMLYSNMPHFPKTQTAAGNRIFYANYKEGFDLETDVDYTVVNEKLADPSKRTAVSMFKYKVGVVYYNDYNESTTVLLPVNQNKSEVEVGFSDRLTPNNFKVTMLTPPPLFATKMKFVVNAQTLNYETLYITYAKKIGKKLYLYLNGYNTNKLKEGDSVFIANANNPAYKEYFIDDVGEYDINDGMSVKGLYAVIDGDLSGFDISSNGANITKTYGFDYAWLDWVIGSSNPLRFDASSGYQGVQGLGIPSSALNRGSLLNSDFGNIKEGDTLNISIQLSYHPRYNASLDGTVTVTETLFASQDYPNVGAFVLDTWDNPYFSVEISGNNVNLLTTSLYPDLVRNNIPSIYNYVVTALGDLNIKSKTDIRLERGIKPIIIRTKNQELLNTFYFETPKTYIVSNGQYITKDGMDGANPFFRIGFYNGYVWGNGAESYKIKDIFNAKKLNYNFRGSLHESIGYKLLHKKNDITYSGIYNHELGINQLSVFNPILANWKTLPIHYGEIQRIISTDGDITVFQTDKVIQQLYGKSVIMDVTGIENVGLSKEVLGNHRVFPYEFGISENPESVAKYSDLIFFTDKKRKRILVKQGDSIQEINAFGGGFYHEGIQVLNDYDTLLGSYDEANNEYVISLDLEKSVGFSTNNKGFSSYYTYKSDYLFGSYGKFFAAYKGVIYENEVTDNYNNFAGQGNLDSLITFAVSIEYDSDKVFKAAQLITNDPWDIKVKTDYTESEIPAYALQKKESYYYTDIFRSNSNAHQTASGIGVIKNLVGNTITVTQVPSDVSIGDYISIDGGGQYEITNVSGNNITVTDATGLTIDDYIFALKKYEGFYSPDGEAIRGKWMEVTLTNGSSDEVYLTGFNTEIVKSYL